MEKNKIIGNRIKELREAHGLSQDELAKHLKISRLSVGNYERGDRSPDATVMYRLIKFFNVSANYMLGFSGAKDSDNELLMSELGLTEKSINLIKNGIPSFGDMSYPPNDERTLLDTFNSVLNDDFNFCELLAFIRLATSPVSFGGSWGDSPKISVSPDEAQRAIYRQEAHNFLDKIISNMGPEYIKKWNARILNNDENKKPLA